MGFDESDRRAVGLLCLLAALIVLPSLGMRDLWAPDEPRYAAVSHEMHATGDYLVPHLNGEIYSEKPPLFFWASAALQTLGLGAIAGRVVTGLFAFGTLLVTWRLGRLWLAPRAALLGVACLATSGLFAWLARAGVLDVPLTFFTTLAAYGWFRFRIEGGRSIVLFYLGMGLAVLVKGPVGIVVPLLAVAAGSGISDARRHPAWGWHLLWGTVLTCSIVAAWLVPACVSGGAEYTQAILFKQNLGRAVASWSHSKPVWYYLPRLLPCFFPWILVAPFAMAWAWKHRREARGPGALALWFVVGLVFFTALSGKRERYLMPLGPALALVVAAYLDVPEGPMRWRWPRRAVLAQHVVLGAIGAGFCALAIGGMTWASGPAGGRPEVLTAFRDLLTVGGRAALLLAGAGLLWLAYRGWRALRSREWGRSAAICVAQVLAFFLVFDLLLVPRLNTFKSPRDVTRKLERILPQNTGEIALFGGNFSGAYNCYTERPRMRVLHDETAVTEFLAGAGPRVVLITREDYEGALLAAASGASGRPIDSEDVGNHTVIFLANWGTGTPVRESGTGSSPSSEPR